jgi:hypothetical protein
MIRLITLMGVGLLGAALIVGWRTLGRAGERQSMPVHDSLLERMMAAVHHY